MTELRGPRVLLRPTREEDLPHILAWQNHPEIARWMDYDQTFTLEDIRASEALARGQGRPFVIEVDGRAIGRIGLNAFQERDATCSLYVFIGEADVEKARGMRMKMDDAAVVRDIGAAEVIMSFIVSLETHLAD